jgi:hypothetical protein
MIHHVHQTNHLDLSVFAPDQLPRTAASTLINAGRNFKSSFPGALDKRTKVGSVDPTPTKHCFVVTPSAATLTMPRLATTPFSVTTPRSVMTPYMATAPRLATTPRSAMTITLGYHTSLDNNTTLGIHPSLGDNAALGNDALGNGATRGGIAVATTCF